MLTDKPASAFLLTGLVSFSSAYATPLTDDIKYAFITYCWFLSHYACIIVMINITADKVSETVVGM